jgi:hypothetical protein
MEEIRKRIEAVAWANLPTSSGDGAGLGKALAGLLAAETPARTRAARKIACQVVLQFDLFEAAVSVVPVLVEIVKAKAPGRTEAYSLLFDIANGFAPPEIKCNGVSLMEACRNSVLAGQEFYLRDLGDADTVVKLAALDLLEFFPEAKKATAKRLREVVASEKNADIKIRFLTAAETLGAT